MEFAADAITEEAAETFLASLQESGNTRNAELAASLCHPDVIVDDHGSNDPLVGRDPLRELFDGVFRAISDIEFARVGPPLLSADRTVLGARWRITGTRPGGGPFQVETVDFYRFQDGLVREYTIHVRDRDWLGEQFP